MTNISKQSLTQDQSQKYQQTLFQTTTSWLEDFLAKLFQLRESVEALLTQGELYSLTLRGYSKKKDLVILSLKMLKDSLTMTQAEPSPQSLPRLMSWGMTSNGKCLTAKISESPRIGKECSLSDILEENPDPKYFLSEKTMEKIMPQFSYTIDSNYWKGTNLAQYKKKRRRQIISVNSTNQDTQTTESMEMTESAQPSIQWEAEEDNQK